MTIPIGFLGCVLGTLLSPRVPAGEAGFDELLVRSETGAQGGPELRPRRRRRAAGVERPAGEPVG